MARSATHPTYRLVTGPIHSYAISTSRGAYNPIAKFPANRTIQTHKTAFTVLPGPHLLLGGARVGKVPCLEAQRRSIIQPSPGSNPRCLACKLCTLPVSHDAPQIIQFCCIALLDWIVFKVKSTIPLGDLDVLEIVCYTETSK